MTHAQVYDIAALLGLVLAFAGAWMVFGIGAAMLAAGWLIWFSSMFGLHLVAQQRRGPG